jgi:hypothetical protein
LRNHGVKEEKSEINEDRWWGLEFIRWKIGNFWQV